MKAKKSSDTLIIRPGNEMNNENTLESLEFLKDKFKKFDTQKKIILDLIDVVSIDSSGINLILGIQKELTKDDKELLIKNNNMEISKLLKFSGFANVLQ